MARGDRYYRTEIVCDVCGKTFIATRYDATTCSATCRSRKLRAKHARLEKLNEAYWSLHRAVNLSSEKLSAEEAEVLKKIERVAREKLLDSSFQVGLPWNTAQTGD